jgi:hypothetical protein
VEVCIGIIEEADNRALGFVEVHCRRIIKVARECREKRRDAEVLMLAAPKSWTLTPSVWSRAAPGLPTRVKVSRTIKAIQTIARHRRAQDRAIVE